jgi:hypothetical protein
MWELHDPCELVGAREKGVIGKFAVVADNATLRKLRLDVA